MHSFIPSTSSFPPLHLTRPSSPVLPKGLPPQTSQLPFILAILKLPFFYQRFTFELRPCTTTFIPESKWEAFYILELMALLGLLPKTWKKSDYVMGVSSNWSYSFLINKCAKKHVWKCIPELPSKYPRFQPALEHWSLVHTLHWLGHHLTTLQQYQWSIWNTGYSYEKRAMYLWKTVLALNLMDIPNDPPVLLLPHSYILSFDQTLNELNKEENPVVEDKATSSPSPSSSSFSKNPNLQVVPIRVPIISVQALVSSTTNESTSTSASISSSSSSSSSPPSSTEDSIIEPTPDSHAPIWTTVYYVRNDPLLPLDSDLSDSTSDASSSNHVEKDLLMFQEKPKFFLASTSSFSSQKTPSTSSLFSMASTLSLTCSETFLGNDLNETGFA